MLSRCLALAFLAMAIGAKLSSSQLSYNHVSTHCRFADIGTPKGVDIAGRGSQAAVEGWLAAAARTFMTISQAPSQAVRNVLETEQDLYAEPGESGTGPLRGMQP